MKYINLTILFCIGALLFSCSESGTDSNKEILECNIMPPSISFGSVPVGKSILKEVILTNASDTTLSGIINGESLDFSVNSGNGEFILLPEEKLSVIVEFQPRSIGAKSFNIKAENNLCEEINCTGTGFYEQECSVSTEAIFFGRTPIGEYTQKSFTISNTGSGTLAGSISITSGQSNFTITSGNYYSLSGGESREFIVRFFSTSNSMINGLIDIGTDMCPNITLVGNAG